MTGTVDPLLETASEEGRALAPVAIPIARRLPFAARVQAVLIAVMLLGMVLIGQQVNKSLYQIGLPVLVVAAFLQIAFGSIPPRSGFAASMRLLALTWAIIAAVIFLAVRLAPTLIGLGR